MRSIFRRREMYKKTVSGIMMTLLFIGMFSLAIIVKPAKAEWTGSVYIRADGSIDPPDAPITTSDNMTYIVTSDLAGTIIVERDNIVLNGTGHSVSGIVEGRYWIRLEHGIRLEYVRNVTVTGFNINSVGCGIEVFYSNSCNIVKNIVTRTYDCGIYLSSASNNNSIFENNLTNNRYGIFIEYSEGNCIYKNRIQSNRWVGMYLHNCNNNVISENNITGNHRGGVCVNGNCNRILKNFLSKNRDSVGGYGILIEKSSNNIIFSNNFSNNCPGVSLVSSFNNSLLNNVFIYDGISVPSSYNNIICNNTVNGKPLVYLENVSNYSIEGGDLGQIVLVRCRNIKITNVKISDAYACIGLWETHNCKIFNNSIPSYQKYGILLEKSYNNTVCANKISPTTGGFAWANTCGLGLFNSCNNKILQNVFTYNWAALKGLYSSNNLLYHNAFIANYYQIWSYYQCNDTWDLGYPYGGNYWSDHITSDMYKGVKQDENGGDGICDNPYIINEYNIDHYPLMGPFNSFNISVGHSVDVISNSTVEDFNYFESNSTIVMHVASRTANQVFGFCRLTIPHDIMSPPYTVKVNDTTIEYETIYENYTEGISIIYFTYEHSKLEITIIPEFPTTITTLLLMLTVISIIVPVKRKVLKRRFPT